MNARLQLISKTCVNHPVLCYARNALEDIGTDHDAKVTFSRRMRAGMTMVLIAFVNHTKEVRLKALPEFGLKFFANWTQFLCH